MHGYEAKEQKWNPNQMIGPVHLNSLNSTAGNQPNDNLTSQLPNIDSKTGIQLINSIDCSSNGSVLMNGSSNSNTSANSNPTTTLINPLINSGNGTTLLNSLTTFDHNELRSTLTQPDSPSDLSTSD